MGQKLIGWDHPTVRGLVGSPRVPCFAHPGSKYHIAPLFIPVFPKEIDAFVSGCTGTGAVVFWIMRAVEAGLIKVDHFILNDIDPQTVEFLRQAKEIGDRVKVPDRTRDNYEVYKVLADENDPEAILMVSHLTYNGGGYEHGCYGGDKGHTKTAAGYEKDLREACRLLRKFDPIIICGSWENLPLETLGPHDFYFHDGPYIERDVRKYKAWGYQSYINLRNRLPALSCMWAMNEYRHEVYSPLGSPFWRKEVYNKSKHDRSTVIECLWKGNYTVLDEVECVRRSYEHTELDGPRDGYYREGVFRNPEGAAEQQEREPTSPLQQAGDPAIPAQPEGYRVSLPQHRGDLGEGRPAEPRPSSDGEHVPPAQGVRTGECAGLQAGPELTTNP